MLFSGRNWPLGLTRLTEVFDSPVVVYFSSLFFPLQFTAILIRYLGIQGCTECRPYGAMAWFARGLADQSIMQL